MTEPQPQKYARQAKWRAANPQEVWAQAALRSALKKGLIARGPCERCGAVHDVDGAIVDGHHSDYSRPAQVTWLCRGHHKAEHRRLKAEGSR